MRTRFTRTGPRVAALVVAAGLVLSGCGGAESTEGGIKAEDLSGSTITVATHDSWGMSEEVLAKFTADTGITVKIATSGDGGTLTNKLVLTKDAPIADGVFGIDNTFASRAIEEGVFAQYAPLVAPASLAQYQVPDQSGSFLTPVDFGDVCVNIDDTWFAEKKLTPPATFEDLVDPAYKGLLVTPGASTSSPGLAFLLATIGTYGDDWKGYWEKLLDNDVLITSGWSDAYQVDFTAGGGKGDRPIVVSYSSSPPFTVPEGGTEPTTSALLDTCFRQVEYAGVLNGAKNPLGMQKFIDFMIGEDFQAALPENMYVYPVNSTVDLPAEWAKFAPVAENPVEVAASEITKNRAAWTSEWRELTTR